MARAKCIHVVVTPELVRVRYEPSQESPYRRFYMGAAFFLFVIALLAIMVFMPGKHAAPSIWDDLHPHPGHGILIPVFFVLLFSTWLFWSVAKSVRYIYPGDQEIVCNRESLVVSWVPWMDWSNTKRVSESYPLGYVSGIRYGVIVSGKGKSTYGLRFNASGTNYRLFPDLSAYHAGKILAGMEALGVETERKIKHKMQRA